MQLNPYLTFDGRCEAAFRFYERTLGGRIDVMVSHANTPMGDQVPAEWRNKIMHAQLSVGDQVLMGSDSPAEHREAIQGCSVALITTDPAEAERAFRALSEKGTVRMPIQQTFWAVRFGMLTDQFGVPWMVNCQQAT